MLKGTYLLLFVVYLDLTASVVKSCVVSADIKPVILEVLLRLLDVILESVMGYFTTFRICWSVMIEMLVDIMGWYFVMMDNVVNKLTEYPTVMYASGLGALALISIVMIIRSIFDYKRARML